MEFQWASIELALQTRLGFCTQVFSMTLDPNIHIESYTCILLNHILKPFLKVLEFLQTYTDQPTNRSIDKNPLNPYPVA